MAFKNLDRKWKGDTASSLGSLRPRVIDAWDLCNQLKSRLALGSKGSSFSPELVGNKGIGLGHDSTGSSWIDLPPRTPSQPSGHRATLLLAPTLTFTPCISPEARSTAGAGVGLPKPCYPSLFLKMREGAPLGRRKHNISLILPQLPSISEQEEPRKTNTLIGEVSTLTGRLCGERGGRSSQA